MMSISQQQRIRLPSVNAIFPSQLPPSPPSYTPTIHSPSPVTPAHQAGPMYHHNGPHPHQVPQPPQQQQHPQHQQHSQHQHQHQQPQLPQHQHQQPQQHTTGPVYYSIPSPNITYPMTPVEVSPYTPRYYYAHGSVYVPGSKYRVFKQTRQSNAWSYEDDMLLKHLKEVRNLGWREISCYFKNRTANGCQFRWRRLVALAKLNKKDESETEAEEEERETDSQSVVAATSSRSNSLERILN